jgi:lipopolysaccharide/colanic/teichoic acid biosynthesis glycosyltransferase
MTAKSNLNDKTQQVLKWVMDLTVSSLGLIFLSPFIVMIAAAIKLDTPGSVFYRHQRIGKNSRPFILYKFRSMREGNSDSKYMQYLQELIESERSGDTQGLPYRKMGDDPRVTRVGRFLRRFYLDELPQLINIVKGEMSLVGPRPHVQFEVDNYTPEQKRRLSVKPGMTGLWQVIGKADCTFNELIALDLEYIDRWSIGLDLQLLFKTLLMIFLKPEGAKLHKPENVHGKPPPIAAKPGQFEASQE